MPALIQTGTPAERNVVSWRTVEPVGVGSPNPSGEATFPLRWLRVLNFGILVHLAPAERDVRIKTDHSRRLGILPDVNDPARLIRRERRSAFRFFLRITYYTSFSPSGATCISKPIVPVGRASCPSHSSGAAVCV